jgi:hypothetical protein
MSARRARVAKDFHRVIMAACADALTAQLAELHAPVTRPGDLACKGCAQDQDERRAPGVTWPCATYKILAAEVLSLPNVDAALTSLMGAHLTSSQVSLLRFLGGQLADPPVRTDGTYQALIARGLIARGGPRRVYQLTERGRLALAALGPDRSSGDALPQERWAVAQVPTGALNAAHRTLPRSSQHG